MAVLTQKQRMIAVSSPLGEDVLLFRRMTATEGLSRLFQFNLDLLSEDNDIKFDDILGQNMTVRLDLPESEEPRYFNGYVSRFSYEGIHGRHAAYQATLRPWFWLLTRTADCRIFQEKKIPDIIKEVFREGGFTDFEERLSGTYRQWEYCVQYRETDFNFLSRLMEQEGIYFYFKHTNGKHTLVLADSYSSHEPVPGYEKIPYFPPDQHGRRERDHIFDWTVDRQVQPGVYALNDFDFKIPRKSLHSSLAVSRQHAQADFEIYDYPGEYVESGDGNSYTRTRIEELQAQYEVAQGRGNARGLAVGALFTLTGYPREDQNREYLIVSANHELQTNEYESDRFGEPEERYECAFSVMEARQSYRPPRLTPKPVVQGPQTAIVVGKQGEEIWTDEYGRVKCQFHWDRYGKSDENSSCWIRVSQIWAGTRWGGIHIPRIGQEVIVDFLEGDPDQPIITGRVYNGDNMPPYTLPDNRTQSGVKSRSSKGGSGNNFNEIRFEDKKQEEQILVHAERNIDMFVENDSMERVIRNRHLIVGTEKEGGCKGSQKEQVNGEKHLHVKKDQVEKIEGNMFLTVGKGKNPDGGHQHIVIEKDKKELIEGNSHLHVKSARKEKIDGDQSLTVGMSQQEKVGMKHALDAGQEIHLKAGMKVIIEAGLQLTIKGAGGFIDIGPAGVTIQGTLVNINSGGAAGSGSGSSPEAPEDAEEAKPAAPVPAKSGEAASQPQSPTREPRLPREDDVPESAVISGG